TFRRSPEPKIKTPAPPSGGFRLMTAAELAGPAPDNRPPIDLSAFRPGVMVRHPQYGLGRIVAIDGAGPNRKGRVAFTVGGEKTFILAKSPLRVLNGG
ncbi:MAG: DNA helicase UvrD, partial [Isosphaeraceae bacterium]|nr:DNA helicase UvrD [Isosphaeraceae bacterium]